MTGGKSQGEWVTGGRENQDDSVTGGKENQGGWVTPSCSAFPTTGPLQHWTLLGVISDDNNSIECTEAAAAKHYQCDNDTSME